MSENTYFGDICIPWITNKDSSISGNLVEKNFVDSPPQVFQLTPDIESGTYSFVLNEDIQDKGETFAEQIDAVRSMDNRHGCEFPFSVGGDTGHILVNSSTVNITPSNAIRTSDVELRFLSEEDYRAALVCEADHHSPSFSPTPEESVVAIPETTSAVQSGSSSLSPEYTITTEDGVLEYYLYSDREIIEYERESSGYGDYAYGSGTYNETDFDRDTYGNDEQISPVRTFDAAGHRVYSTTQPLKPGSHVKNGLIDATFNEKRVELDWYDNGWSYVGDLLHGIDYGHPAENRNYNVTADFNTDLSVEVFRGFPALGIEQSGITSVEYDSESAISLVSEEDYYIVVSDNSNNEIILMKTFNGGSFNINSPVLSLDNLNSSQSYYYYIGIVPEEISFDDYARYLYNIGEQKRSFVQR